MKSQQCAPLKHHYDECAERVMQQQEENGKADEDCVEECTSNPYSNAVGKTGSFMGYKLLCGFVLTTNSLPPHALRIRLCCSQAIPPA
jgi:hypothetical protein